ncbi:hypothetical protein GS501_04905 [Saccharibacter sp. 17.LH.SD]|uniref:hypothetical protein n=1 Tax=Saccharibacter sp. 17.LH.SD TaxID=2689393 RepID=UPI00136BB814|nr:hypothetical protein [Saccharibacter sp. 17.LH.SD]MXV44386.1 hypothetical protein [Saccharibacter sp. 17.LH.SD]
MEQMAYYAIVNSTDDLSKPAPVLGWVSQPMSSPPYQAAQGFQAVRLTITDDAWAALMASPQTPKEVYQNKIAPYDRPPSTDQGPTGPTVQHQNSIVSVPLSPDWETRGHVNDGDVIKGYLSYAGGISTSLGVGDTYAQGPSWTYIHLKPAQQPNAPQTAPDLYLTFNQKGELGYSELQNNGIPQYHFVSSPSDIYHDTAIVKTGVRTQQNRRDPIYLADQNGIFHGVTENAVSGTFGSNPSKGEKPLYTLFLGADETSFTYAVDPGNSDPNNPTLSWGTLPTAKGVLQGTAGLARKQWDARVGSYGETLGIYNDIGPAGAFADTKITIEAFPIDAGLVGRYQAPICLPIANKDGTCSSFTFYGPSAAFYRFVATGRLA